MYCLFVTYAISKKKKLTMFLSGNVLNAAQNTLFLVLLLIVVLLKLGVLLNENFIL